MTRCPAAVAQALLPVPNRFYGPQAPSPALVELCGTGTLACARLTQTDLSDPRLSAQIRGKLFPVFRWPDEPMDRWPDSYRAAHLLTASAIGNPTRTGCRIGPVMIEAGSVLGGQRWIAESGTTTQFIIIQTNSP